MLNQIDIWYQMLVDGWFDKIDGAYFAHLYRANSQYEYRTSDGSSFTGTITNVEPNGRLSIVDSNGGTRSFLFKEVEFVLNKG